MLRLLMIFCGVTAKSYLGVPGCIVVPVVLVQFCNFIVDVVIDVRLWYRAC